MSTGTVIDDLEKCGWTHGVWMGQTMTMDELRAEFAEELAVTNFPHRLMAFIKYDVGMAVPVRSRGPQGQEPEIMFPLSLFPGFDAEARDARIQAAYIARDDAPWSREQYEEACRTHKVESWDDERIWRHFDAMSDMDIVIESDPDGSMVCVEVLSTARFWQLRDEAQARKAAAEKAEWDAIEQEEKERAKIAQAATARFRKSRSGAWVVYGPVSEVVIGSVPVRKRGGSVSWVDVVELGKPFTVDGEEFVYGYPVTSATCTMCYSETATHLSPTHGALCNRCDLDML